MFTKLFSKFHNYNIFRNNGKQLMLVGLLSTLCYSQKLNLQVNPNIKQYGDKLNRAFKRTLQPEDDFYKNTIILSGNANKELAEEIAEYLNIKLGSVIIGRFADGECQIQVLDNIRGKDVFIIQSTSPPVNDNLMELLLLVSALRRASARKIIVVVPYYGYARQVLPKQKKFLFSVWLKNNVYISTFFFQLQGQYFFNQDKSYLMKLAKYSIVGLTTQQLYQCQYLYSRIRRQIQLSSFWQIGEQHY